MGIVIVKDRDDIINDRVVLEEAVVLSDLGDIPNALAVLMGLLYTLNIDYPKELKYTFEVMQRVLINTGAGQCSALVHAVRN